MTPKLIEVFKKLLDGSLVTAADFAQGEIVLCDYSDPEHFNAMWRSLDDGSIKQIKQVLIIWDSTPPDEALHPINTSDHVSPLHWAVCAAMIARESAFQTRVTVLDLNPKTHQGEYLYDRYLGCDKRQLPWLRVIEAAQLLGKEAPDGDFVLDTEKIDTQTLRRRLFPEVVEPGKRRTLRPASFCDCIREQLVSPLDPANRHGIANIIGPMLLLQNKPSIKRKPTDADHGDALRQMLASLGLIEQQQKGKTYSGVSAICNGSNLRIILVDDQARHGWLEWLEGAVCRFLPGSEVVCLQPGDIAARIAKIMGAIPQGVFDKRFSLNLIDDSQKPKQEILCLDLRLFSGADRGDEVTFYSKLLEFWQQLASRVQEACMTKPDNTAASTSALAWEDNLTVDEVCIGRWCSGKSDEANSEADHQACLTLPVRLISQLDMAFPIILFSSTGQAGVLKKLRSYGNVILDFEKPRFFDPNESGEIRQTSTARLKKALIAALALIQARTKCVCLQNAAIDWKREVDASRLSLENKRYHVELFVDESGSRQNLKLGGLFAIFENVETPSPLADAFDDVLVTQGVRYFDAFGIGPQPPGGRIKAKSETCAREFENGVKQWRENGFAVHFGFVQVGDIDPEPSTSTDFDQTEFGDNRWRLGLEALIELFLFETLPAVFGAVPAGEVSVSIFAPTRVLACDEGKAKKYEKQFGWELLRYPDRSIRRTQRGEALLRVFSRDDLYALMAGIPRSRIGDYDFHRALALRLAYENDGYSKPGKPELWSCTEHVIRALPPRSPTDWSVQDQLKITHEPLSDWRPDLRALHYVCDQYLWANGFGFDSVRRSTLTGQFREKVDQTLVTALRCRRCFAEGRLAEAVAKIPLPTGESRPGLRMIAADIGQMLRGMTGREFCDTAARLDPVSASSMPAVVPSPARTEFALGQSMDSPDAPVNKAIPAAVPTAIVTAAQPAQPTGNLVESSQPFETRYLLTFPKLPNDFTAEQLHNLLQQFTDQEVSIKIWPVSLDSCAGFVWFKSEGPLETVYFRTRRFWGTQQHILAPGDASATRTHGDPEDATPSGAEVVDKHEVSTGQAIPPEQPSRKVTIRLGGIPAELERSHIKERLRRYGITHTELRQYGPTRGSTKSEAEFVVSRKEAERFMEVSNGIISLGDTECLAAIVESLPQGNAAYQT